MMVKCVVCNKIFKPKGNDKTCSSKCSIENTKLRKKKYFDNPKNHEKHLKVMREYMKRPDVIQKEKIRKNSPKYKAWQKKYISSKQYKENQNKRYRKNRLKNNG